MGRPKKEIIPVREDLDTITDAFVEQKTQEEDLYQQIIPPIPVQEDVAEDESPKDIPEVVVPQPIVSHKFPRRPDNERVVIRGDEDKVISKPDFKAELIEKPAIKTESLTIPTASKSGQHYARRNVALIKDINKVLGNPSNIENNGVFKLSKNKAVNNAGSTINTGAHFQNKQGPQR